MMGISGKVMTRKEKLVVLQIDGVAVKSVYEYDRKEDQICEPHKSMYVCQARGLFRPYKQVVYCNLQSSFLAENLLAVIKALHCKNFRVIAISTDNASDFQRMRNDLNVCVLFSIKFVILIWFFIFICFR